MLKSEVGGFLRDKQQPCLLNVEKTQWCSEALRKNVKEAFFQNAYLPIAASHVRKGEEKQLQNYLFKKGGGRGRRGSSVQVAV